MQSSEALHSTAQAQNNKHARRVILNTTPKTRGNAKEHRDNHRNTVFKGPGSQKEKNTQKMSYTTQTPKGIEDEQGIVHQPLETLYSNDETTKQGRATRHSPTGIGNNFSEGVC